MYDKHLANLGLDRFASIEEIKSSYRQLAKKYHPDICKNGVERFRSVTDSYDWLLKYHTPIQRPKDTSGYDRYYEILSEKDKHIRVGVYSNTDTLDNGLVLFLMRKMQEYKVVMERGTKLPKTIMLIDTPFPLTIDFFIKE